MRRWMWRRELHRASRQLELDEMGLAFPMTEAEVETAEQEVRSMVGRMAPGGIDEGTGHALDGLIDAQLAQWHRQARQIHLRRQATAEHLIGLVAADRERWHQRKQSADRRLAQSTASIDAAIAELAGTSRSIADTGIPYTTITPDRT